MPRSLQSFSLAISTDILLRASLDSPPTLDEGSEGVGSPPKKLRPSVGRDSVLHEDRDFTFKNHTLLSWQIPPSQSDGIISVLVIVQLPPFLRSTTVSLEREFRG